MEQFREHYPNTKPQASTKSFRSSLELGTIIIYYKVTTILTTTIAARSGVIRHQTAAYNIVQKLRDLEPSPKLLNFAGLQAKTLDPKTLNP